MRKRTALILVVLILLAVAIPVAVTFREDADPARPERADAPAPSPAPPPVVETPSVVGAKAEQPPLPEPGIAPDGATNGKTSRDPKPWAKPPAGFFGILTGDVVDVGTGDPIVGAKIAYGPFPACWGARTDGKGGFRLSINPGGESEKPWRLRVTAPGYENWETTPAEAKVCVELIPASVIRMAGRIRGRVLDSDGRPLSGAVRIVLEDGEAEYHYLTVLAEESGGFLLEAVEPGGWKIRHYYGKAVDVFVPEDDEVPITIRSSRTREELDRAAQGARKLKKLKQAVADAQQAYAAALAGGAGQATLNRLQAEKLQAEARLGSHGKRIRRPEMSVTGVPAPDGTRLVLSSRGSASTERWWAVVKDGVARFPSLYPGTWTLTLMTGKGATPVRVEVPEKGDLKFPK